MNFKYLLLILLLVGCGVKGPPIPPNDYALPSLLENYPDVKLEKPLEDNKKIR